MTMMSDDALGAEANDAQPLGRSAVLRRIFFGPLPCTPAPGECRSAPLFRSSIALNYVTGGARDMTFSARCHLSKIEAKTVAVRLGWMTMETAINAGCRVVRGERRHCATALRNHASRADEPARVQS